jgi:predicted nucleic acid-binding protein
MIEPVNNYVALLDACTVVPMPLCHTLLNLAEEPALYIPKWSEEILAEVERTLLKRNYSEGQVKRRLQAMRGSFEDAVVAGYEDLIPVMNNDPKDRHVLAAAVRAGAHVIVTQNIKHFPIEALQPYGISLATPDEFLSHQFHLEPGIVMEAIERQASDINSDVGTILKRLKLVAPSFVQAVTTARSDPRLI